LFPLYVSVISLTFRFFSLSFPHFVSITTYYYTHTYTHDTIRFQQQQQQTTAGFPFAGNTGFGAMSAHIPDDGYCLTVYGPHVGVAADGTVGKVERSGIDLIDTCCGSAVAASNYVDSITNGGRDVTMQIQTFTDFQQNAVQELILPHGKRLADADIDGKRMVELPYALYDSQNMLLSEIVKGGSTGIKRGLALLGGVQINTGPDTPDYFVPLRFDYMNYRGDVIDDLLPALTGAGGADDSDDDDEE
jgi:hypothetical protein